MTSDERLFIRNERLLSALDFEYWARRYAHVKVGGGALAPLNLWDTQLLALRLLASCQRACDEQLQRGEPVDGILLAILKARQLGITALFRALSLHRLCFAKHQRALAASIDEDKIQELYDRDHDILDNLPWWMRPSVGADEKRQHISFDKLGTRILYQTSNQKSGVGQGRTFEVSHLTECASWDNPNTIEFDFIPAIPQSINSLCGLESTANEFGWWYDFVTRIRTGRMRRWHLLFIPWYAETTKYRATPPSDWQPSEVALLHAQQVADTSHEYVGQRILLAREQLYWWESTRAEYQAGGKLNFFLANYPATVEESFQHANAGAFGFELVEQIRLRARWGTPLNFVGPLAELETRS